MNRHVMSPVICWVAIAAVFSIIPPTTSRSAAWDESFPFPDKAISAAKVSHDGDTWILADSAIKATLALRDGGLCLKSLDNLLTGETLSWSDRNLFTLRLGGDKSLASSAMKRVGAPKLVSLDGSRKLAKLSERFDGKALTAVFEDADTALRVTWSAILRDGANALRQEIVVSSTKPVRVADIEMLHAMVPGGTLAGYTDGSPITAGNWFLGMEHPMANPGKMPTPAQDPVAFKHEMRMTVGYASGLGELYVTPRLLTPEAWDCMAECIQWARARKALVADAHWVGGNPGKNEIYGFAAWNPRDGGVLTLRDPDDNPRSITLNPVTTFEMPSGSGQSLTLKSPWKDEVSRAPIAVRADQMLTLSLHPFEVMTLEVKPSDTTKRFPHPDAAQVRN